MPTILADANIQGHVKYLVRLMQAETWSDFWNGLSMKLTTFAEVGLKQNDSDALVWNACHRLDLVLITANRTESGTDSLEAVIKANSNPKSLLVITISDAEQMLRSRDYAAAVVISVYDILMRLDELLGTGRFFVPGPASTGNR